MQSEENNRIIFINAETGGEVLQGYQEITRIKSPQTLSNPPEDSDVHTGMKK